MFKYIKIILLLITSVSTQANLLIANDAIENGDFVTAKKQLEQVATVGNAEAQLKLGLLHYQGKSGEVDKLAAFAWLLLASEQNMPDALNYVNALYAELSPSEQVKAKELAVSYGNKYGQLNLLKTIYPLLLDEPAQQQIISTPAKETFKYELLPEDPQLIDKEARARRASVEQSAELISRLNQGYRHNAYDNLDKFELRDESGLVIVQHDVNEQGEIVDPEVIFSWPINKYDDVIVSAVLKNKYSPAIRDSEPQSQYNLVDVRRIGIFGKNSYRTEYPKSYEYFLKMKKASEDDLKAKYIYASLVRAYGDVIGAEQPKTYQQLLLELSESHFLLAQYDYAQYLIYQADDIDKGLYWLLKAAVFGYTNAEYRLGDILLQSPSSLLLEDKNKAIFWLTRAAEKGHIKAQEKLALINTSH